MDTSDKITNNHGTGEYSVHSTAASQTRRGTTTQTMGNEEEESCDERRRQLIRQWEQRSACMVTSLALFSLYARTPAGWKERTEETEVLIGYTDRKL